MRKLARTVKNNQKGKLRKRLGFVREVLGKNHYNICAEDPYCDSNFRDIFSMINNVRKLRVHPGS